MFRYMTELRGDLCFTVSMFLEPQMGSKLLKPNYIPVKIGTQIRKGDSDCAT